MFSSLIVFHARNHRTSIMYDGLPALSFACLKPASSDSEKHSHANTCQYSVYGSLHRERSKLTHRCIVVAANWQKGKTQVSDRAELKAEKQQRRDDNFVIAAGGARHDLGRIFDAVTPHDVNLTCMFTQLCCSWARCALVQRLGENRSRISCMVAASVRSALEMFWGGLCGAFRCGTAGL